jgi:hypothetical protein
LQCYYSKQMEIEKNEKKMTKKHPVSLEQKYFGLSDEEDDLDATQTDSEFKPKGPMEKVSIRH